MERTLRKVCGLGLVVVLIAAFTIQVCAQKNSPSPSAPRGLGPGSDTSATCFSGADSGLSEGVAAVVQLPICATQFVSNTIR